MRHLRDLGLGKEFLDLTRKKAWPIKGKTIKTDFIKTVLQQKIFSVKWPVKNNKITNTGRKYFQTTYPRD